MLTQHAPDLWSVARPMGFMGLQFGARMVVVRIGERLVLHSPISLSDEDAAELAQLGDVGAIVAPNLFHHLFAGEAKDRFPNATLVAPKGLEKKRGDLSVDIALDPSLDALREQAPWDLDVLVPFPIAGQGAIREFVFHHRPSQSLLTTDLVLNVSKPKGLMTKFYSWVSRYKGEPIHSPLLKLTTWSDKKAGKESLETVLAQDFDRLLLAHGDVVESGGKAALANAFGWLLKSPVQG